MMMMLILSGKELFLFLFGEKWLPAVPYFQILSIASIVRPLSTYNLNILKVKGRSDLFLKVEIIKKAIGFLTVILAIPFGLMILVISYMVVSYIFTAVNMFFSGKLINYPILEQVKDSAKVYLIGVGCLIPSYFFRQYLITFLDMPFYLFTIVSGLFGMLYLLGIYLFDQSSINLIKSIRKD